MESTKQMQSTVNKISIPHSDMYGLYRKIKVPLSASQEQGEGMKSTP